MIIFHFISPSKSNEAQSAEQSLTSSRLSISSMGLRRKTLLNSRQDSTLFLQDTFNDESEVRICTQWYYDSQRNKRVC